MQLQRPTGMVGAFVRAAIGDTPDANTIASLDEHRKAFAAIAAARQDLKGAVAGAIAAELSQIVQAHQAERNGL